MKLHTCIAFLCAASALASAAQAGTVEGTDAWDVKRFQLRGRVIGVIPDESSSASIGGTVGVGDAVAPEVDLSYYFTDYVSAELIAATTQHSLSHSAAGDLGRTWVLPPTVTLQYHPTPYNKLSPYVGAGLNYSIFYGEDAATGNGITSLDVNGGVGYALQVGTDYWLDEHWGLNVDVKKLYLKSMPS